MKSGEFRLGLTLSGGGFRATLFHLGVVRLLHDARLLPAVKYIGSVSGGSILAAHLVLNWDRYTGDEATFDSAAQEIIAFVRSDVRGRVVRRWILASLTIVPRLFMRKHWTFTNLLQGFYERLYKSATLGDLHPTADVDRPQVFFYCTSLSTGSVCSFGRSGFTWYERGTARSIRTRATPIAFAVAASSAFPPLFPPIAISHKTLFCSLETFPNSQYLTDGGVYDNLGIDQLIRYHRQNTDLDLLLVSDAEGQFEADFDQKYTFTITRNIRASNLLMKRVSTLAYDILTPYKESVVEFKIDTELEKLGDDTDVLSEDDQRCLQSIRTDLDAFSPTVLKCLIQHGYTVARHEMIKKGLLPDPITSFSWESLPLGTTVPFDRTHELSKSQVRKLRLWSFRDWASWVSLIVIACLGMIGLQLFTNWFDLAGLGVVSPISRPQSTLTEPANPQIGFGFIKQAFAQGTQLPQRFRLRQRDVQKINTDGSDEIYIYDGNISTFPVSTPIMIFIKPPHVEIPRSKGDVLFNELKNIITPENIILEAKVKQGTEFSFLDKKGNKYILKIVKVNVYIIGEDFMDVEVQRIR